MILYYRIFICLVLAGMTLYAFIDKQNQVTEVRLAIPLLTNKVKKLQEENGRLQYEIDRFESPIHLMELAGKSEFGHLKYPYTKDVIIISENEN